MAKNILIVIFIFVILVLTLLGFVYFKMSAVKGITVISPNGGEVFTKGQNAKIMWHASKDIKSVNIYLQILGNEDSQNFNAAVASNVVNTGNYNWVVQELYSEVWGIKTLPVSDKYIIVIEDSQHNNIYDASDSTFSIE
ncbi:MAG: hypothetical protein NT094_04785 [Candidatus Staskawiczbacteria bacterium]|nr:hypothetical protein [Candidatus Staskawiczbacteria bacterium]